MGDSEHVFDELGPLFFEVHKDLPREGPGSTASTVRALQAVRALLPKSPKVVDVGCGPGAQTLVLATELPDATITAVDLHAPFVEQLRESASTQTLLDRIDAVCGDMGQWSPHDPVDLVWCEGAAYFVGVERALHQWAQWLEPNGCVAFTEAVWLTDSPTPRVKAMWEEYPELGNVESVLDLVRRCGYEVLNSFVLPASDWLEAYYAPMQLRIDALRAVHGGDPAALAELDIHQEEIDVYREFGAEYGYLFTSARREGAV